MKINDDVDLEMKILVVDDMENLRLDLIKTLRSLGFKNISEAKDGKVALEKVIAERSVNTPFDLILSDINMPELNGIGLLEQVRKNPKTQKTPFILISTENEQEIIIKALTLGVNNYIIKPITIETVTEKINATFKIF